MTVETSGQNETEDDRNRPAVEGRRQPWAPCAINSHEERRSISKEGPSCAGDNRVKAPCETITVKGVTLAGVLELVIPDE